MLSKTAYAPVLRGQLHQHLKRNASYHTHGKARAAPSYASRSSARPAPASAFSRARNVDHTTPLNRSWGVERSPSSGRSSRPDFTRSSPQPRSRPSGTFRSGTQQPQSFGSRLEPRTGGRIRGKNLFGNKNVSSTRGVGEDPNIPENWQDFLAYREARDKGLLYVDKKPDNTRSTTSRRDTYAPVTDRNTMSASTGGGNRMRGHTDGRRDAYIPRTDRRGTFVSDNGRNDRRMSEGGRQRFGPRNDSRYDAGRSYRSQERTTEQSMRPGYGRRADTFMKPKREESTTRSDRYMEPRQSRPRESQRAPTTSTGLLRDSRQPLPSMSGPDRSERKARRVLERDVEHLKRAEPISSARIRSAEKWHGGPIEARPKHKHAEQEIGGEELSKPLPSVSKAAPPRAPVAELEPIVLNTPNTNLFASYKHGNPPTADQLTYANAFFTRHSPRFLMAVEKFRDLPQSSVPEVVFLGRSNVGKSSLLNALMHRTSNPIAHTSSKPGRTKTINAFAISGEGKGGVTLAKREGDEFGEWTGRNAVVVMDMPGYGKTSRPEWGKEITKYLEQRKQLRRAFVLVDAEHGLKDYDLQVLELLRQSSVPHQLVVTKIDKNLFSRANSSPTSPAGVRGLLERVVKAVPELCGQILQQVVAIEAERDRDAKRGEGARPTGVKVSHDVVVCSAERDMPGVAGGAKIGIDGVRWAVLSAAGMDCDDKGNRRTFDMDILDEEGNVVR